MSERHCESCQCPEREEAHRRATEREEGRGTLLLWAPFGHHYSFYLSEQDEPGSDPASDVES